MVVVGTEVMNYDVFGSFSSTVGPNSPLADSCAPASAQFGSATSAVQKWTAAGFPAGQILLGVASYGHSFLVPAENALTTSTTTSSSSSSSSNESDANDPSSGSDGKIVLYAKFDSSTQPQGDAWDVSAPGSVDVCGDVSGGTFSGIWDFWGLVEEGWLDVTDGETGRNVSAAEGVDWVFDECSVTVSGFLFCGWGRERGGDRIWWADLVCVWVGLVGVAVCV